MSRQTLFARVKHTTPSLARKPWLAAVLRPGQGPRMSRAVGAMKRWTVSPTAGTKNPPFSLPLRPFFALLYAERNSQQS